MVVLMVMILKKAPVGADQSSLVAQLPGNHRRRGAIPANVPSYRAMVVHDAMWELACLR
jgi:hypothetical protein